MEMMRTEEEEEEDTPVSIPIGGPIYVPNLIGPLTTVRDFETSVFHHLQDLEAEIRSDSSHACNEDISVDELKIFSEEELVNKAFEEAFKDGEEAVNSSHLSEDPSSHTGIGVSPEKDAGVSHSHRQRNTSASIESENGSSSNKRKNTSKKRKTGRHQTNGPVDDSYLVKVEQLAKIKQKQDEEKSAARLHSFDSSCKVNECSITSSENIEKMTALRSMSSAIKVKSSKPLEYIAVRYPEVILCVEVYHNIRTGSKTQEFLVLGQQTLTELKDNIYCLADQAMRKAGQDDPSGYFFIEDVFCNDLRDPNSIDYSEPIFDWLRNSKDEALEKWEFLISGELQRKQKAVLSDKTASRLPQFRAVDMHKTRFCDLNFRLGAGYLYCHQGDCKHTIVIRDLRLIHPEDVQNRAAYPLLTFQQKFRFQKCAVCKIYRARKVTVNDKWAQENPCYLCDNCYFFLHYSKDGSLLYTGFEVYDYHHD